jgi:hypothetical protein
VPLETPIYGETDFSIEQSVNAGYNPDDFDMTRDDEIDAARFDEMNAIRDDASHEAHRLAISGFESDKAEMPRGFEVYPGAELSGIASMTKSVINSRAVALGLANAAPIMPYMAETVAKPVEKQNSYQYAVPNEQVISRSTEDPRDQFGLAA